jgi:hypothetical protein
MRRGSIALSGIVALGLVASTFFRPSLRLPVAPVVGGVGPLCTETMDRSEADLHWIAPERDEEIRRRGISDVSLGELEAYSDALVRVAGVLHLEFEWVALHPSHEAIESSEFHRSPWVDFESLWPNELHSYTRRATISDRCAVIEATYSAQSRGHMGLFNGTLRRVLRLDVWSEPHRPVTKAPPPPPPPPTRR